ncbi:CopG family transcriptional regulator [Caulobacter flavus]|uniref:CopG family transcriptional regulator n=2 Tax=Caulobacter flavus TaxID=1679497 RepID=A0A2N5CPJ4_9CAUL|nr:CopG family transcriptional regulator [Caulobacter flavus]PLR08873.1 CopG family transcriptional regulator [Caulobacter flavus]
MVETKVYLPGEVVRALDETARRLRRSKSEIVRAAVASYLSPDGPEALEAALSRRLDRLSRQVDRLERDLTISNETLALYVRTWLRNVPSLAAGDDAAASDLARERYARFIDALARRLSAGKLLRNEIGSDEAGAAKGET